MFNDGYDMLCLSVIANSAGQDAHRATGSYCGCWDYLGLGKSHGDNARIGAILPHGVSGSKNSAKTA